jgi:ubiquinone/menaquinone biosynthesis C-methylase UbiE
MSSSNLARILIKMDLFSNDSKSTGEFRESLRWQYSTNIRAAALEGMNSRGTHELSSVQKDSDIINAHGEHLTGYLSYELMLISLKTFARLVGCSFKGTAADLGSGTGIGACILSKIKEIKQVYAVEYSEVFVQQVMPVVFRHFGAKSEKIQRVIGDFNHLQLPDHYLDLVVEIGSFHHSEDLGKTLGELWRVMKPGAILIAHERAHPDNVTDRQLEEALNQQLASTIKHKYGIAESENFTRGDAGEHEYRIRDWRQHFENAGFDFASFRKIFPPIRGLGRVLHKAPFLDFALLGSVLAYRAGKRKLYCYGLSSTSAFFLCRRKP